MLWAFFTGSLGREKKMVVHPQGVKGPWKAGSVLDWHTVGSQIVGHNEFGHPIFDNKRSEIGELLYQFKYKNEQNALQGILQTSIDYFASKGKFDLILPVPPSNPSRTVTSQIAQGLAAGVGAKFSDTALIKCKNTNQLKSVSDPEIRKEILSGAFQADRLQLDGMTVLLVDDLYRSGATLEAATETIMTQGNAKSVYVFAITRTRVHR